MTLYVFIQYNNTILFVKKIYTLDDNHSLRTRKTTTKQIIKTTNSYQNIFQKLETVDTKYYKPLVKKKNNLCRQYLPTQGISLFTFII